MSRRLKWKNIDKQIAQKLIRVLATNPYVQIFRSLFDLGPLDNYRVTLNASVELDQMVYNRPTTSEVTDPTNHEQFNLTGDVMIHCVILYFFPNGEFGWHSNIPRHGFPINNIINDDDDIHDDLEDLYQGVVDCVNAAEVRSNMIGQRVVLPASVIGGPCDMRRQFLDAMTLVQDDGNPDIFLTMTCNPNWPEIKDELLP
ncbi:unnamed protein product [Lactuca saligna]|uniref:Helitron helicase-like domain-containing protein n=1 Tax=Lactuca saligna TaxID=75948 RepID=A0AA35VLA9_LACSI|nr:unnamed protein product [Lactuca saligna]